MAISVTKPELSGSTAVAAALRIGTSYPELTFDAVLPTAVAIKAQADKAIVENVKGGEMLGRSEQRMTYAVMCEAVLMRQSGQTNRGLADTITDSEALTFFNSRMSELFAGEKPETDKSESGGDTKTSFAKKDKLVKRGVKLGAMLEARGVSYSMFNVTAGLFNVWPSMLHPVTATPLGRLTTQQTILLDGRTVVFLGKNAKNEDKPMQKNASMAQVLAICGKAPTPRKPQPAKKVSSGATFNLRKVADVADHIEFPILVAAVLVKMEQGGMRKADWPGAWNNLSKVQVAFDELRKSADWELPKEADEDKLAATKAKREAQAAASKAKDAAAKAALAAKNAAA